MKDDFCYTQAQVDEVAGRVLDTSNYGEGVDWKRKVQGRGTKVWWHKSVYESFCRQPEVTPEDWRAGVSVREFLEANGHVVRPTTHFDPVRECKIVRVYPNFKWVETDEGRVWVGLKGSNMKRGQVIRVQDGKLYTGKIGSSASLVRVS